MITSFIEGFETLLETFVPTVECSEEHDSRNIRNLEVVTTSKGGQSHLVGVKTGSTM